MPTVNAEEPLTVTVRSVEAQIDFAIVTAVKVEREAVCQAFELTARHRCRKGSRVYWRKRIQLKHNEFYEIVVAQSPDVANVDAAILTNDMIHHWKPSALLLVGIAGAGHDGSDEDDEALGDLILGSHVYYYERGKVAGSRRRKRGRRGKTTSSRKVPEPYMYPADATLWNNVRAVPVWNARIPVPRPDGTRARPKIYEGVIASGEKVIAEEAVRSDITSRHRKIRAIEMEGYGFSNAAWQSFGQHRHLVIRAICDRANLKKKDLWQPYAAAVAAGFAKHFLLDRPLSPQNTRQDGMGYLELVFHWPPEEFDERKLKRMLKKLLNTNPQKLRIVSVTPGKSTKVTIEGENDELVRIVDALQRSSRLKRRFAELTGLKSVSYVPPSATASHMTAEVSMRRPMTKSQIVAAVAQKSGLEKKQVVATLDAVNAVIVRELGKKGPGEVTLPGLLTLKLEVGPAKPASEGVNPFTKQAPLFRAKSTRKVVNARPVKALKDAI